ncbi:hypothetical protein ACWF7H_24345 [Peribacillus butanolivorans]|uniref:hypothetical protein n=1 Tax=Peribacillus butanolivorans TaxID=421767 RepID=UPI00367D9966
MARFERHSSSNIFDFSTQQSFGHVGEMFIDQTRDMDFVSAERTLALKSYESILKPAN